MRNFSLNNMQRIMRITPLVLSFLLALCSLLLSGCEAESPATEQDVKALWQPHLTDYTQGWIGAESPLRIRFSHAIASPQQLGKPLDDLVSLNPKHDVVAVFTADNVLEIRHPEPFKSGQQYQVELTPQGLKDLPEDMPPLHYEVRVLEQEMSLRETGLAADADGSSMQLGGVIETTDSAIAAAVEKVLSAQQQGKALNIRWQHVDARTHQFTVEGIVRGDSASTMQIRWDGTPIGVKNRGEREIAIPAAQVFEVMSARAVVNPDSYIEPAQKAYLIDK